jgi:formylglycine-generating enzyme required for sulfatase activity/serine/threonine protein kinase
MDAPSSLHPTDQTLSSYGLGKLDDGPAEAVNKHLEGCPDCRKRVAEMSADSFLDRVRDAQKPSGKSAFGQSQAGGTQSYKGSNSSPPPPADTLPPGLAEHPDYEIKRELGRGGMGVVYLAHNALMGRDEVLKVMGRQIMERPGVLDRFVREIRAVAKLRHPNIVSAYHATRLGESIVFAMEYVEGLDLSKMVKAKGPLPVGHACNFVYQAALGLQHAHEEGLVHRDIKPANLMLSRKGEKATVKVLDFGLAKVAREEKIDGGLTMEGQALGTPDFIAPEQILDAPSADIRADIYSLGATLYYLLSGRPPFKATSLYDMYQAHISRDADLLNLVRPEVPSELAALVAKMMAKDPARRFQTPAEVAQALAPYFKKGSVAFKSPKADISQDGQMNAGRPVAGVVPKSTQPPTEARGPIPQAKRATEPNASESRWESLIDFKQAESDESMATPLSRTPSSARARRPPWLLPTTAAGGLILGMVALCVIIIWIRTKDGEVVLKVPPNGTTVTVANGRVTVDTSADNGANTSPAPADLPEAGRTPPADARDAQMDGAIQAKLSQPIPMKYVRETPLEDVLKDIRKATAGLDGVVIPIYVDPVGLQKAQKAMTSPIRLDLEGVPLEATLRLTLKQVGMDYCVKDGLLYISDEKDVQGQRKNPSRVISDRLPRTTAILARLDALIPMKFANETPLENVLKSIKDATKGSDGLGIPIYVDPIGLQEAQKTMTSPVCLNLEGVPLRTTLRLLLAQLGLGYYVKEGLLSITSLEADEFKTAVAARALVGEPPGPPAGKPQVGKPPVPPARPSPETFTNSVGMKLVLIPDGDFEMGSPGTDRDAAPDEKPRHRVRITQPFFLGSTEVTQGQYRAVTGTNPSSDKASDQLPVENVTWDDAIAFCNKLSEKEGLKHYYSTATRAPLGGDGYRLPTEAQWEYASRAGSQTRYCFGDEVESLEKNTLERYAWYNRNSEGRTHEVGRKLPNGFGLFDMYGNVWEFCSDNFRPFDTKSPVEDPCSPTSKDTGRATRGGCYNDYAPLLRSALRRFNTPPGTAKGMHLGFRVALGASGRRGVTRDSATDGTGGSPTTAVKTGKPLMGEPPGPPAGKPGVNLTEVVEIQVPHLGIWYKKAPRNDGTFGAQLTRDPVQGSPMAQLRMSNDTKLYRLERRDTIIELGGQGFRTPDDVWNHWFETTMLFVDQRTGQVKSASLTIPRPEGDGKASSDARHPTTDRTRLAASAFTSSIGMKLVLIPPGEFQMGSTDGDNEEKPQHRVRLTRSFYLGVTEVTQAQHQAVMGNNPSHYKGSDDLPVEHVSWLDTIKFCNKLSEREGREPYYRLDGDEVSVVGGNGYRLPTEAEWEYACRAGSATAFGFGNDKARLGDFAWFGGNSGNKTHPVGQKQPNAFGLYDMHGNVWEWCWDGGDRDYYKQSPLDDPPGAGRAAKRVFRGGSYSHDPHNVRSAYRIGYPPGTRFYDLGFRVARETSERRDLIKVPTGGTGGLPTSAGEAGKPLVVKPPVPPAVVSRSPTPLVTVTFRPGVNGYEGASGLNYFGSENHRPEVRNLWADSPEPGSSDPTQEGVLAVLRFDSLFVPGAGRIPPGSSIIRAKLCIVTGPERESAVGHGATVHRIKKPIDFMHVLTTLIKDAGGDQFSFIYPPTARVGLPTLQKLVDPGPIELDVTADVQAWSSGSGNYGWAFLPWPNGTDGWGFRPPDWR